MCGGILNSQNFEGKDWGLTGISRAGGVARGQSIQKTLHGRGIDNSLGKSVPENIHTHPMEGHWKFKG